MPTEVEALQLQIDDLQIRLLHQEDLLQSLSDVVANQGAIISLLQKQLSRSQQKWEELTGTLMPLTNERPPHY